MPEIPKPENPEEQPTVVQIVYQVPSEEAPILPEQLSVLESKTGLIVIIILAIWGLVWYFYSGGSTKSSGSSTEASISVNNF